MEWRHEHRSTFQLLAQGEAFGEQDTYLFAPTGKGQLERFLIGPGYVQIERPEAIMIEHDPRWLASAGIRIERLYRTGDLAGDIGGLADGGRRGGRRGDWVRQVDGEGRGRRGRASGRLTRLFRWELRPGHRGTGFGGRRVVRCFRWGYRRQAQLRNLV